MAEDQRANEPVPAGALFPFGVVAEVELRSRPMADDQRDSGMAGAVVEAVQRGDAAELRTLLEEGANPNAVMPYGQVPLLLTCLTFSRPECVRLVIEAGANVNLAVEGLIFLLTWLTRIFPLRDENAFFEGDYILTMDILLDIATMCNEPLRTLGWTIDGKTLAQILQSLELEEGSRKSCERDGLVALFSGQYWEGYDGRNPFLQASAAEEMLRLLIHGAANNENGHADMTRLRSIKPTLRRRVMELLDNHLDMHDTFIGFLVAVAKSDGGTPLSVLNVHESPILPLVADYLGVRGRALRNAREVLDMLIELATGIEWEYDAGDW